MVDHLVNQLKEPNNVGETLKIIKNIKELINENKEEAILINANDCIGSLSLTFNENKRSIKNEPKQFFVEPKIILNTDEMEVCNELNFNEVEEDEIYSYRIIQSGIIPNLLQFISHSNPSVILSALRALKNIFSTPSAPRTSVIEEKNIIENLENLLKHENEKIIENAAKFIANLCCTKFLPPSTILSLIPPQDSLSIPTFSTFPNEIIRKRSALESLFKIQNKLANSNIISHLLHIVALNGTSFFLFFPFFPLSFPLSFPPLFPFPFLLSFSSVIFLCSSTFHYFPLALFSFFVFPPSSFDSITSRVLLFTHFTPPIILYSF